MFKVGDKVRRKADSPPNGFIKPLQEAVVTKSSTFYEIKLEGIILPSSVCFNSNFFELVETKQPRKVTIGELV